MKDKEQIKSLGEEIKFEEEEPLECERIVTKKSVEELLLEYNINIKPENRHILPPINIIFPED